MTFLKLGEKCFSSTYFSLHDWYKKIRIGNKQGIISAKEAEKISKKMSLKSYEGGYRFMVVWMAEKLSPSASNKLLTDGTALRGTIGTVRIWGLSVGTLMPLGTTSRTSTGRTRRLTASCE